MREIEKLKMLLSAGAISRRQFLTRTAVLGAGVALPASMVAGPAMAAQKKGGHFRLGMAHGETTDTLDCGLWENAFLTALGYASQGYLTEISRDGSVVPGLAESWESSPDASEWTFKLRKGLTFHSGKSLTTDDVIAAINHHRGEESTSAAKPIVADITDISADGPDTVTFTLAAGNADFPFTLSDYHLAIMPSRDGKMDFSSGDGLGVYKIDNFEPGVKVQLSRFADHWADDRGFFESADMLSLVDTNARTTALVSGDVDAIDSIDLKTVALLKRNPDLKVHSVAGNQHYTFVMSCTQAPFTDVNVRQAMKYGVNREELVEKILQGYGVVGNDHPIGPGQRFFNKELAQTTYDPDKARWHLEQAGLDSLKVNLSAADAAFSGAVDAAVLYQNSAKEAGIDISVVREPNDGYWSDVWMKKPFSAVYWSGRSTEDAMFATAYQTGAAWNDAFWSNARFDELLTKARAELDNDKRREMYYEMQALLNQDGGTVIPMFASYVFGTSDKLEFGGDFASNWVLDGQRSIERWSFA